MKSQRPKQTIALSGAALLALALMPTMAAAQFYSDVQSNGPLHLKASGSFLIQGTTHFVDAATSTNQPGLSMINQMYVQFQKPLAQNGHHVPIVFVHGGGLSSKSWQTTPDGRMGWDEYFVRQGFDTYMIDQVGRARSGFDGTAYNKVRTGELTCHPDSTTGPNGCRELPAILIGTDQFAWNGFRWGQTPCNVSPCYATTTPHPNLRFPIQTVGAGNAGSQTT